MEQKIKQSYLLFVAGLALAQSFIFATYQLFLSDKGISYMGMNLINAFFMLGNFIFQVPTGAFADCCGRKNSIILGSALKALCFFGYYLSSSIWMFIGWEILGALGNSFVYGALDSWMVDEMKDSPPGTIRKLIARGKSLDLIVIGVGSCLGGYLGQIYLGLPWLAASLGQILLIPLFYLIMKETNFRPERFSLRSSWKMIVKKSKSGIQHSLKNRSILQLIIFSSIASACFMGLNMQWQGFFQGKGFTTSDSGWIFFGISISIFLGTKLVGWYISRKTVNLRTIFLLQGITAIAIIITTQCLGIIPIIVWFMLHEVSRGTIVPLKKIWLQDNITSEHRTTIPSFEAMVNNGGNAAGLIISGYLATSYSINTSWLVSGIILLITVIVFARTKN